MGRKSAGILMYRFRDDQIEFLLVHPGGPFWAHKDVGAWSIPKGEFTNEDALAAARREFLEETGIRVEGEFAALTPRTQKGGKTVYAWAVEGDLDASNTKSNLYAVEWPPKSGKKQMFPEVDRAEWFPLLAAIQKINRAQIGFIAELVKRLGLDEQALALGETSDADSSQLRLL